MKVIIALVMVVGFLFGEDGVKKVVIDLTTADVAVYEKKILSGIVAHKTHYENSLEELEVAVVIHGGAYRFFLKSLRNTVYESDAALQKRLDEMQKRTTTLADTYGVEFLLCDVGRKNNKLSLENLLPFVKVVPNSTIGLIDKQNEGYAYIPVAK